MSIIEFTQAEKDVLANKIKAYMAKELVPFLLNKP